MVFRTFRAGRPVACAAVGFAAVGMARRGLAGALHGSCRPAPLFGVHALAEGAVASYHAFTLRHSKENFLDLRPGQPRRDVGCGGRAKG